MSKQAREKKRAEEERVLAELEAAVQEECAQTTENAEGSATENATAEHVAEKPKQNFYGAIMPEQIHCRRCRTLMEKGVCPTCGYKIYVPISEEKRKKIRNVGTIIALVAFLIIFVAIQASKG